MLLGPLGGAERDQHAVVLGGAPAPAPLGLLEYCARTGACGDVEAVLGEDFDAPSPQEATSAYTGAHDERARFQADASANFAMMLNARALSADVVRPRMALTRARWRELSAINSDVNAQIEAQSDADQFGVAERWSRPIIEAQGAGAPARGDCEDYALEKRALLLAAGWAPELVALAVARLRDGELHTVVIASTDRGDFVLDNLHARPLPAGQLDYTWISRQAGAPLGVWSQARLGLLTPD